MKLAYLITRSDTLGGAHIHVRDLSVALRDAGHRVTVLTGGEGPYTRILKERSVEYRSLRHLRRPIRPWLDIRAIHEIRSVLRDLQPDLLSTHSSKAGLLGRVAARSLGIPVIFTAHGWAFAEGVPTHSALLYRWLERLAAPLADRIITVSERDRHLALHHRIAGSHALTAIHNGMPDVLAGLRADPARHPPRMISVARLEPQKDHPLLLRALSRIRDLDWTLDLVGDGPLTEHTQALAAKLGIADRVRFLGLRRDVSALLRGAELFLLISNWEGLPRSILEAMRAGLPVMASDVGGVSEAVVDGRTGFLVPRGDVDVLEQRLREIVLDSELRSRMGQDGRRRYEERFTFERMMARTLEVYRDVVAGRRRNPHRRTATGCVS